MLAPGLETPAYLFWRGLEESSRDAKMPGLETPAYLFLRGPEESSRDAEGRG
jgi:hypothetical protein